MKTSDLIVPGVITVFSCVVIYLSLQLDLYPPMIVGHSMQPRAFPIFLMVINLILIGLLTYQFYKNPDYNLVENFVQVVPRKDGVNVDTNKFCLFKLNGTIGGTIRNNEEYVPMAIDYSLIKDKVTNEINQNIITNMMERFYFVEQKNLHYEYYKTRQQDEYPTITYSWEKNPVFEQIRKEALKATKDTRILVIIGYSFPTFNRILDKKILQNMGYIPKVFIQSPSSSIEGVMQRFKALYEFEQESEIIPIVNVDEFYIPFEY
jgi:hypothetical protein